MAKFNILDRLVLFRHGIERAIKLSKNLKVFHTKSKDVPVVLKFSYAGNTQYHKLTEREVHKLISELSTAAGFDRNTEVT